MAKIFYKKLLHRFHNNFIISSVENQKIPLCFVIEHMGKKLGQCAVCSQCLEKGGLESGSPHQNIDGNAVIKNTHAVSGVRRVMHTSPCCKVCGIPWMVVFTVPS